MTVEGRVFWYDITGQAQSHAFSGAHARSLCDTVPGEHLWPRSAKPRCEECVEETRPVVCNTCEHREHFDEFCAELVDEGEGRESICGCGND